MATSNETGRATGMIGAGSAALRKVITKPLELLREPANVYDEGEAALPDESINSIIEGEIIPRLLMAHTTSDSTSSLKGKAEIDPSDVYDFSALPLRLEAAGLLEEVDGFIAQGVSVEAIFLDLLTPAARRLGDMWVADECDFVDVTMGLWRLQEVMREISSRAPIETPACAPDAGRALFAPMPGDQHSFGALMIEEIFARSGWRTRVLPKPLRKELLDTVSREPFDIVGLTLSRDCPSSAITNLIKAIRNVSANPNLSILIGGRTINDDPAIVTEVGADGTGADARAALEVAQRLVQSAEVRAHMLK